MTNINAPFGMRPVRHKNGQPYNGAVRPYFVPASDGTALFVGDPVIKTGSSNTVQVSAPGAGTFNVGALPSIARATAGTTNRITGVIVGFAGDANAPLNRPRPPTAWFMSATIPTCCLKFSPLARLPRPMWA